MADSHDSPDFIQSLIKLFYMVGGVLVAGTLITVLIDVLIPMPLYFAAIIGLSIALVKSCFVIAIFMHYKWDKKLIMITWTMILTFFFFAGMMGLIMWTEGDIPKLHRPEMHAIWPVLASLIGILLPVSFAVVTVKIMNRPSLEYTEPVPKKKVRAKSKRTVRKLEDSETVPKKKVKAKSKRTARKKQSS
tara:strand:+ start:1413 stop:1982 length:570 start_codon:yes stop_codon:yes gene_type:complete